MSLSSCEMVPPRSWSPITERCVLWRRLWVWEAEKAERRVHTRSGGKETQALSRRGSKWAFHLLGLNCGRAEFHGLGPGPTGRRSPKLPASLDRGPV